jgi:hypothetical protein
VKKPPLHSSVECVLISNDQIIRFEKTLQGFSAHGDKVIATDHAVKVKLDGTGTGCYQAAVVTKLGVLIPRNYLGTKKRRENTSTIPQLFTLIKKSKVLVSFELILLSRPKTAIVKIDFTKITTIIITICWQPLGCQDNSTGKAMDY